MRRCFLTVSRVNGAHIPIVPCQIEREEQANKERPLSGPDCEGKRRLVLMRNLSEKKFGGTRLGTRTTSRIQTEEEEEMFVGLEFVLSTPTRHKHRHRHRHICRSGLRAVCVPTLVCRYVCICSAKAASSSILYSPRCTKPRGKPPAWDRSIIVQITPVRT